MLISDDFLFIFSGSVLPLGKMELNPVAGLVLLSKSTTVSDDKPCLADLDSDTDDEDNQGNLALHRLHGGRVECLKLLHPLLFLSARPWRMLSIRYIYVTILLIILSFCRTHKATL